MKWHIFNFKKTIFCVTLNFFEQRLKKHRVRCFDLNHAKEVFVQHIYNLSFHLKYNLYSTGRKGFYYNFMKNKFIANDNQCNAILPKVRVKSAQSLDFGITGNAKCPLIINTAGVGSQNVRNSFWHCLFLFRVINSKCNKEKTITWNPSKRSSQQ